MSEDALTIEVLREELRKANARADREHELRCNLERRFDHRIANRESVIKHARAWTGVSELSCPEGAQRAVGDLLQLVDTLDAERIRLGGAS